MLKSESLDYAGSCRQETGHLHAVQSIPSFQAPVGNIAESWERLTLEGGVFGFVGVCNRARDILESSPFLHSTQ